MLFFAFPVALAKLKIPSSKQGSRIAVKTSIAASLVKQAAEDGGDGDGNDESAAARAEREKREQRNAALLEAKAKRDIDEGE